MASLDLARVLVDVWPVAISRISRTNVRVFESGWM